MSSVFNWRTEPSQLPKERARNVVLYPNSVKFNGSTLSGSIATSQKTKQKPATGRNATS